jgi:hypothetical protein
MVFLTVMQSLKPGDDSPMHPSGQAHTPERSGNSQFAVVGNGRLTALAGAVLLVLMVVEIVSAAILHTLLPIHVFVGVLLAGPLVVKLGSTGWRFLRYYTGAPAFVRRGPPHLALRLMAPLLIAATVVVIGSGVVLVMLGPAHAGPFLPLHGISALVLLPLLAIHVFAHTQQVPRLVADDWSSSYTKPVPGRALRLGSNLGALLAGTVAAILLFPGAAPWLVWSQTNEKISAPLIVGLILAALALVVTRPFKWR